MHRGFSSSFVFKKPLNNGIVFVAVWSDELRRVYRALFIVPIIKHSVTP